MMKFNIKKASKNIKNIFMVLAVTVAITTMKAKKVAKIKSKKKLAAADATTTLKKQ